jgi:replicative DNA helicase Mcm
MALAKDPQIKQKIIQSIAPTIYGNEDVKLAVAFSLFGGVKNVRSYETTRGDIHTLLIGDPATGKSVILQQACTLIPRSIFTNGKGSSVAGLTAGFVAEKDKSLSLEVGAMVLASGGLAVIDEFDNMREGDRSAMHQVMEQQQYSLSKAGFQGTIATETTVIAAANPKLGRYSEYHTISENINLSPPLLSRFDLILVLRDKPDEARDRKIARQIFKKQGGGAQTGSSDPDLQDPPIPKDLLRKYIYHARKTCRPVLKEEAHALLEDFYVQLRKTGSDEKNAVSLCARQLSGLVRICQALAKMRLSNEATVEDAKDAKDYLSKMLKSLGYDEGTMNIDAIFCNVSPKVRQTTERVMKAFDDLIASNPPTTGVAVVDIYESLIASGSADIERSFIQDVFDRLLKEGKIALTGSGYRPIKG